MKHVGYRAEMHRTQTPFVELHIWFTCATNQIVSYTEVLIARHEIFPSQRMHARTNVHGEEVLHDEDCVTSQYHPIFSLLNFKLAISTVKVIFYPYTI